MSRIFLSHSSRNNAEALALRDWLATQGWHDVFLDIDPERGLVAADRWQNALRAAIGRCRAVIFLVSPAWLKSKHCISELDLAGHVGAERIGVIIKNVPLAKIPGELSGERQLIKLCRGGTPVTFRVNPPPERKTIQVTFPEEDLRALRAGLARLGLVGFETESFPWPPPGDPDRAPYRGLEALDTADAGVFFGRDSDLIRAREELIDLRAKGGHKLFVIEGASGSGKSSFLRAGLIPRLEREDPDFLTLPLIRPKNAPLSGDTGFARSLELAFEKLRQPRPLGELIAALEDDADALPPLLNELQVLAMQRLVGDAKPQVDRPPTILLAIDQAEELFAFDAGREAARTRQHLAAALTRGPDAIALLTIRSDRFSLLQGDDELKHLLEPFNLPAMSPAVYRETIFRPAGRANPPIAIDEKLAEVLISETTAESADPLPLLAFSLERLYQRYGRALKKMELAHYDTLGRIAGSIEAAAREALAEPERSPAIPADREEQDMLLEAAFFPALVGINENNAEPVSRIAKEAEIPPECQNLVNRLVEARLIVRDRERQGAEGVDKTTLRVAHEAVLRRWEWLRDLLDHKAGLLQTAQSVERAAQTWDDNGRSDDWLDLRGERLADAEAVADRKEFAKRLKGLPADYLAACRKHEDASKGRTRRMKLVAGMLSVGVAALLVAGGYWWFVVKPYQDARAALADMGILVSDRTRGAIKRINFPNSASQAILDRAAEHLRQLKRIDNLDLSVTRVTDLTPLQGLTGLRSLDLSGTQVADLTPLQRLTGLRSLNLTRTQVADLTPLRGLAGLQTLNLLTTPVADLTPLAGLTGLQSLNLKGTPVADLTPLQRLTGLQSLNLWNTPVTDLTPLAGLTGLKTLNLSSMKVAADITPLKGLAGLQALYLSGTRVTDFTPLQGLTGLVFLNLSYVQVTDVTPLAGLSGLKSLDLGNTQVADVTPLAGLNGLQLLSLTDTQIADVTPLGGLTGLRALNLSETKVTDVSPLKGLSGLQSLDLSATKVPEVSPFKGLTGLLKLDLRRTQVADLTPLAGLTGLQTLNLSGTQVADVTALKGLTDLQSLYLEHAKVADVTPLQGLTGLQRLNLRGTKVTEQDVDRLRKALPGTEINF